ncbi:MAG: Mur ligase family protein, partial [Pirellulaceae bacterium]
MSVSHTPGTPTGISLRQILPQATFLNTDDVSVASCAGNLNECQSRDLFVALVGAEHDGHEDAELAVRKGAAAVLGERLLPISSPQCIVEDSREAYGKICHALAGNPSGRMTTVGVSGTDGKTTTAHLIHSIFAAAGIESGLQSSLHNKCRGQSGSSQPTPPALADRLARMVTSGNRAAVVETSSPALAGRLFAGTQLDVAVLTNLRGSHFHLHNTLANYQRTQLRLLDHLKPEGVAILNADDPATWFRLPKINRSALTIGMRQQADITARILESDLFEQTFLMTAGEESVPVRTRIPGDHHVYN